MVISFANFDDEVDKPKYKPPKNPRKAPRIPVAWRDRWSGDLYFDIPYHIDFMEGFKGSVSPLHREFYKDSKTWRVDQRYALSVEDLLEAFFPDIVIDYMGWGGE